MGWILPTTFLAIACLYCFTIDNGSAIKCWECDSSVDPKCVDPFDNMTFSMTECTYMSPTSPNKCKKVKQDGKTVIRSCALASEATLPNNCTKAKNDKGVMVETCFCDKDACNSMAGNGAGISTVTTVGMVTSLFFSVMIYAMH